MGIILLGIRQAIIDPRVSLEGVVSRLFMCKVNADANEDSKLELTVSILVTARRGSAQTVDDSATAILDVC